MPNIHLNDKGRAQVEALATRLSGVKLKAIYSSPLERAMETAEAVARHQNHLEVQIEERVGEVRYGSWTGKYLKQLARTRLWQLVQHSPSMAQFPDGESLREVQDRAVSAMEYIIRLNPKGPVAIVSHGDVIKIVIAFYGGLHLDNFQRFAVDTSSISIVNVAEVGATIARLNDTCHNGPPK